jgi:hypothetical protein
MIRNNLSLPGKVYRRPGEKLHPEAIVKRFKNNQSLMIWSTISGKGW